MTTRGQSNLTKSASSAKSPFEMLALRIGSIVGAAAD